MNLITKTIKDIKQYKAYASYPVSTLLGVECHKKDVFVKNAKVFISEVLPEEKLAKVRGKIVYNIAFLKDENEETYESASEFNFDINHDKINSLSLVNVCSNVEDVTIKDRDENIEISSIINLEAHFLSFCDVEIVEDIEGAIVKNSEVFLPVKVLSEKDSTILEGEKQFNYAISKVLFQRENIRLTSWQVGEDLVTLEGEIFTDLLFLTENGNITKDNFILPFSYEVQVDGGESGDISLCFAGISDSEYKIESDETTSSTTLSGSYTVSFSVNVVKFEKVNCVQDAFSSENYLKREILSESLLTDSRCFTYKYRCFGEASCDLSGVTAICCYNPRASAVNYFCENEKVELSGQITCEVIAKNGETSEEKSAIMPFSFSIPIADNLSNLTVFLQNAVVKQQGDKCFLECEVIVSAQLAHYQKFDLSINFKEDGKREDDNSAISVIFVERGEDMWDVCKKAGVSESQLAKSNPGLSFPTEKATHIVVYHQIEG